MLSHVGKPPNIWTTNEFGASKAKIERYIFLNTYYWLSHGLLVSATHVLKIFLNRHNSLMSEDYHHSDVDSTFHKMPFFHLKQSLNNCGSEASFTEVNRRPYSHQTEASVSQSSPQRVAHKNNTCQKQLFTSPRNITSQHVETRTSV